MLEVEMPLRFILSMMLSIFFSPCCSKLWKQSDGGRVHDDPQEATFEAASPLLLLLLLLLLSGRAASCNQKIRF